MNKTSVTIVSGIIFGGIGFASGYLFSKNKFLKLADKEIDSMKNMQKEHDDWIRNFYSKNNESKEEKKSSKKEQIHLATITPSAVGPGIDRLDYEKKYRGVKKVNEILEKEEYIEKPEINNVIEHEDSLAVRFMTVDEFDMSSNSCTTIYYYEKDGYVTDSSNNPIANYEDVIGPIDYWKSKFDKTDVIYLTNDEEEIDYELILLHEAWKDNASPSQKAMALDVDSSDSHDN